MREFSESDVDDNLLNILKKYSESKFGDIAFSILENGEILGRKISYAQLLTEVESLAVQFMEKQLFGKLALLFYEDVQEFIIAFFTCQYLGIIAVPVPYGKGRRHAERLNNIIENSCAKLVFCTNSSVRNFQNMMGKSVYAASLEILVTDQRIHDKDVELSVSNQRFHETAFIQYTSGSVTRPKGVVISNEGLLDNLKSIKECFNCNEKSIILSWLPFHHDMGFIGNILLSVYSGCSCILMNPLHFIQKPFRWLKAVSEHRVTHSGGPNFSFDLCIDKIQPSEIMELDLSSWRVAYNGSEPVRKETLERFCGCFGPAGFNENAFFPCYGLAEATLLVSGFKQSGHPLVINIGKHIDTDGLQKIEIRSSDESPSEHLVSSGNVGSGLSVKIFSPDGSIMFGELEEGEICISGKSVTKGYWNKENENIFFISGNNYFLRTGDSGFFYKEELFICGRLKEMLIVRGRNYYPYDLEYLIGTCHPSIESNGVVVFSKALREEEELIIIAEIKKSYMGLETNEMIFHLIEQEVMSNTGNIPNEIILVKPFGIPRTTSGKLQRIKCKEMLEKGSLHFVDSKRKQEVGQNPKDFEKNRLTDECQGKESIKKYLKSLIEFKLGAYESKFWDDQITFTESGIDSIRITELVNIINRDFNINVDVSIVFNECSLDELAAKIDDLLWLKIPGTSANEISI